MGKQLLIKPEKCLDAEPANWSALRAIMEHSIQDLPTPA